METVPLPRPVVGPSARGAGIGLSSLHPLFAQITQMHGAPAPMTADELETHRQAIDAAMLADKIADGYGQRHQAQAEKIEKQWAPALRAEGWSV